ncbi:MAG: cytochrome B [Alphaproteobacteria bacterium]|nr:cytochrome B [Alphaproteobacteria bacterium]
MNPGKSGLIGVWDPFVRWGHWALAAAFLIAYVLEDEILVVHVWLGYLAGALVVARLGWGLVGPRHARFSDFVYPPRMVFAYLRDLLLFRARRYLGHSPAGGAMAVALWLGVLAAVGSGLAAYGAAGKGPLTGAFAAAPAASFVQTGTDGDEGRKKRKSPAAKFWEEVHEVLASVTLALVVVHIGGVGWASLAHRENLPRAMWTGWKRAPEEGEDGGKGG